MFLCKIVSSTLGTNMVENICSGNPWAYIPDPAHKSKIFLKVPIQIPVAWSLAQVRWQDHP